MSKAKKQAVAAAATGSRKQAVAATAQESIFGDPLLGTLLTIAAGLSFLFLCMILPLVGPAAWHGSGSPGAGPAPHLIKNIVAFVIVLLLTSAFSTLALLSKLRRRQIDGSPVPLMSLVLVAGCVFLFLAFVMGLLHR